MRALAGVIIVAATAGSASNAAFAQPSGEPRPPGAPQPSGTAAGEPQPPSEPPPPQGEPGPGDGAPADVPPSGEPQAGPEEDARPRHVSYAYGPLDQEDWPRGFSQEDLRGLPECGSEGLPRVAGAPITCRPHLVRFEPAWSIGFDFTTGAAFGDVPTAGGVHGWGVDTHFAIGRYLQIGARYEMLGVSVARQPGEGEHAELSQRVFASARLRMWTDEAGRNAFTLGGAAGLGIDDDRLGGVTPMARVSIARETGLFFKRHASLFAAELAYERALSDPGLQMVVASMRVGAEVNVIPPTNIGERATPSSHVTSLHMLLSAWSGLGASVGVPLVGPVRWESTADFLTNVTRDHAIFRGYEGAQWSARTGLRVDAGLLYLLGQAGLSWYAHDPKGELDKVVHAEIGFDLNVVTLGAWLRWNIDDTFDSAGIVFSFVFGGGRWGARVPPLYMVRDYGGDGGGSVGVGANTTLGVDAHVDVDVKVEPVVIEVPLGASAFGVSVAIDPRVLPIDKLRGAGFVQVELSGPAGGLADFRGQLAGTLDSRGVHVDGWTSVEASGRVVRAKFTIWPPGTHP